MSDCVTELFSHCETIKGSSHWSLVIRRGMVLRLTDLEGGANVGMLLYNAVEKLERYNAPDTLKCQHTFKLGLGDCLYSDMGRIFCSIIADDLGWHDTICGNLSESQLHARFSPPSFQQVLNDRLISGQHAFLVEMAKYGLGERDLAANLNLFSRVTVASDGTLQYVAGHSRAGAALELRFEMDTLVLLHTCPHPLNPAPNYPVKPVQLELRQAQAVAADDLCMNACPENRRGFFNTALYHQVRGGC